jgi:hypothetical protein
MPRLDRRLLDPEHRGDLPGGQLLEIAQNQHLPVVRLERFERGSHPVPQLGRQQWSARARTRIDQPLGQGRLRLVGDVEDPELLSGHAPPLGPEMMAVELQ